MLPIPLLFFALSQTHRVSDDAACQTTQLKNYVYELRGSSIPGNGESSGRHAQPTKHARLAASQTISFASGRPRDKLLATRRGTPEAKLSEGQDPTDMQEAQRIPGQTRKGMQEAQMIPGQTREGGAKAQQAKRARGHPHADQGGGAGPAKYHGERCACHRPPEDC